MPVHIFFAIALQSAILSLSGEHGASARGRTCVKYGFGILNQIDNIPALVPAPGGALLAFADGTSRMCKLDEARALFRSGDVLIANTGFVAGRLRIAPAKPLFDVLELFVFVRPNVPFVPSALRS